MEIGILRGTYNKLKYAKVKMKEVDEDSRSIVKPNPNQILDTRLY